MTIISAWAAKAAGGPLEPFVYDAGPLAPDAVEISVETCGVCHSDLSVIDNEWGVTHYPVVPGHEIIGRVLDLGSAVRGLAIGQRVGVGWSAASCMHCSQCQSGDQNLCAENLPTIVGRHGGFADRVRVQAGWAIPVPDALDPHDAGPLLCGGVTVFNPLEQFNIRPTDRVGVVGIGGLGHMALKFANAWGCEVTAFTSSADKEAEARTLGAHKVVNSRDNDQIAAAAGTLDLLLVTVNVPLDWRALIATLRRRGRIHFVGVVTEPVPVAVTDLILTQRSISGSPAGAPAAIGRMLEFAARHAIRPQTEHFPLSQINDALDHLRAGKARYRVVIDMPQAGPRAAPIVGGS